MEQELSPAQFMPEAPVKRGRGRPRNPDTELSAKTLAIGKLKLTGWRVLSMVV